MSRFTTSRLASSARAGVIALVLGANSVSQGAFHASAYFNYLPGTGGNAGVQNPAAALGAIDGVTGENPLASNFFSFPNVLSPFSGPYQGDEVVRIGEGGQLTLALSNYLVNGAGKRLGVFTNAALVDSNYPSGSVVGSPIIFGGGSAQVSVSQDGINFISLGNVALNIPSLYFTNAGPYDIAAPAVPLITDPAKPFEASLANLTDKNFAQVLAAYASSQGGFSAGGTWLDLSATGLPQIAFVKFAVPDDGNANTTNSLVLDSVSIANNAVGAAVPEPAMLASIGLLGGAILARRRRT